MSETDNIRRSSRSGKSTVKMIVSELDEKALKLEKQKEKRRVKRLDSANNEKTQPILSKVENIKSLLQPQSQPYQSLSSLPTASVLDQAEHSNNEASCNSSASTCYSQKSLSLNHSAIMESSQGMNSKISMISPFSNSDEQGSQSSASLSGKAVQQVKVELKSQNVVDFREFLDEKLKEKLALETEKRIKAVENQALRNNVERKYSQTAKILSNQLSINTQKIISEVLGNKQSSIHTEKQEEEYLQTKRPNQDIVPAASSAKSIREAIAAKISTQQTFQDKLQCQNSERAAAIIQTPSLKLKYEMLLAGAADNNKTIENSLDNMTQSQNTDMDEEESTLLDNPLNIEKPTLIDGLPVSFSYLLQSFSKLEECLEWFKTRNKPQIFSDLRQNMQQTMKATVELAGIQQILGIYPAAYDLKWVKGSQNNNSEQKWELLVQIQGALPRQERIQSFKALLEKKYASNLLENTTHDKLDLMPLPPLPAAQTSISSASSSKSKNDIFEQLLRGRQATQEEKEKNKLQLKAASALISTENNKSGCLSEKLYQLIKAKEQQVQQQQLLQGGAYSSSSSLHNAQSPVEDIRKVVQAMITHFISRKVSNMFYVNLLDHLKQITTISSNEIISIIEQLLVKCPSWIASIPNKQGRIIRIDKSLPMSKIIPLFDSQV